MIWIKYISVLISACLFTILYICESYGILSILGCSLVLYITYRLILIKNNPIPIEIVAIVISGFQWIVSPTISYHLTSSPYEMSVPEHVYMMKALPMYFSFVIGIFFATTRKDVSINCSNFHEYCVKNERFALLLIIMGLLSRLIPSGNANLSFLVNLIGFCLYIGSIMLCFAYPKKIYYIVLPLIIFTSVESMISSMFHSFIIWASFIFLVLFYLRRISKMQRIFIAIFAMLCLLVMQTVKPIYRSYTWNSQYSGNKVVLFASLFTDAMSGDFYNSDSLSDVNSRFNQGWIISRIFNRIPEKHDYLYGTTILEAINATIIPRFLNPNKKNSGKDSLKDFEVFTGYKLQSGTSMGLSLLGEGYGNFGVVGGSMFLFIWGLTVSRFISLLKRLSEKTPCWYFFIPLICFNLIKAEINFISVLNWTFKSFVFVALILYFAKQFKLIKQ